MQQNFYADISMGEHFAHNPVLDVQREQLRRTLGSCGPALDVLDIGCGGGTTTVELFSDPRFRVVGADLSPSGLEAYRRRTGNPAIRVDAEHLPLRDDSFDVVVADDVIEHLVDTDTFAREVHRVLRPGGHLFLTTPNLAAWFNRIALLGGVQPAFSEVSFEKVFGRPGDDIVGHLRLFTSRSIIAFLQHHNFEVIAHEGATFDALPRSLLGLDRLLARVPRLAGNTVLVLRPVQPDHGQRVNYAPASMTNAESADSSSASQNWRLKLIALVRKRFRNTWVQRLPGVTVAYRLLFRGAHSGATMQIDFRGIKLEVPTDDVTMVPSLLAGDYEALELDLFERLLDPDATVLDVGGNVGVYALIGSRWLTGSGKVVSFEPVPENLVMFQANLALAGEPANVTVVPKAVGRESGTLSIGFDDANIGTHSVARGSEGATIEVPVVSLDEACAELDVIPDIIKIDVEGFEPAVLEGAAQILAKQPTLMMEFTPRLMRACGFDPEDCARRLLDVYGSALLMDEREHRLVVLDSSDAIVAAVSRSTSANLLFVTNSAHRELIGSMISPS